MTEGRLRAAIIGTGRIGSALERDPLRTKPHTHAGWYVSHPHILLSGGADTNADRLAAFGAAWGLPADRLFAAYPDMLADVRPDLVSICAYAPERVAMATAALAAGARGLWLEKAVATSVASAERLRAAAAAAGASVVVNHPRGQDPHYRAVRRLIEDSTLGPLESIHVLFSGQLIHTGTHAWDVLESWCGPWAEVRTWPDAPGERGPSASRRAAAADIGGRVHIRFANGVDAFVSGGRKSYFIFQFDLIFAQGRVHLGNDVNQVLVTGPSPRYSGFVELTEAAWRLDGPGRGAARRRPGRRRAQRGGRPRLARRRDPGPRARHRHRAGRPRRPASPVTPATLDPTFVVDSV